MCGGLTPKVTASCFEEDVVAPGIQRLIVYPSHARLVGVRRVLLVAVTILDDGIGHDVPPQQYTPSVYDESRGARERQVSLPVSVCRRCRLELFAPSSK
jgi:hypothetical protein